MFRSKARSVVFPQSEHARLAGTIAYLWGNDRFDTLGVPAESLTVAVTFHDRGYPPFDTVPIGEAAPADWRATLSRGADSRFEDAAADALILFHLERLIEHRLGRDEPFAVMLRTAIAERSREAGRAPADLKRADAVTELCDNVAFDFCFELPRERETMVSSRDGTIVAVRSSVEPHGVVRLDPFPLRSEHESFILAYAADSYPDRPQPVIVPFSLRAGTS